MWDLMLGPLGSTFWNGSAVMPKAAFHHDWSRVVFPVAATANALDAFAYAQGALGPASLVNAIGVAAAANIMDTSLGTADALSRDCIATHMGVKIDNVCLCAAAVGADVPITLLAIQRVTTRLMVRVFYAERSNEEFLGRIEDLPDGKSVVWPYATGAAAAIDGVGNGFQLLSNIRPLPQPLPCAGGQTYWRTTFEPTRRGTGLTCGALTSIRADVYGVAPPRVLPREAVQTALSAIRANG